MRGLGEKRERQNRSSVFIAFSVRASARRTHWPALWSSLVTFLVRMLHRRNWKQVFSCEHAVCVTGAGCSAHKLRVKSHFFPLWWWWWDIVAQRRLDDIQTGREPLFHVFSCTPAKNSKIDDRAPTAGFAAPFQFVIVPKRCAALSCGPADLNRCGREGSGGGRRDFHC